MDLIHINELKDLFIQLNHISNKGIELLNNEIDKKCRKEKNEYDNSIIPKIITIVCKYFNIEEIEIYRTYDGKSRGGSNIITHYRAIMIYFIFEHTGTTTVRLGKLFGKHHTSIMNGRDEVKNGKISVQYKEQIKELRSIIKLELGLIKNDRVQN